MKTGRRIMMFTRLYLSGQTTHVMALAKAMAGHGHRVLIVASVASTALARERDDLRSLAAHGVTTRIVKEDAGTDAALHRAINDFSPHVVHVHSSSMIEPALRATARRTTAVVVTCHGLHVAVKHPEVSATDGVIAVGVNVADDLRRHGVRGVSIVPNGVDLYRFRPGDNGYAAPSSAHMLPVVYVGRIDRTKRRGVDVLINALQGDKRFPLTVASNVTIPRPSVRDAGWCPDPAPLMRDHGVVFGTGLTVREAMASGAVAVILGQRYGGIVSPSTFAHPPPGTDPRNAPWPYDVFSTFSGTRGNVPREERIVADLQLLLQRPRLQHRLRQFGRRIAVKYFDIETMVMRTCAVYEQALQRKASRHRWSLSLPMTASSHGR